MGEERSKKNPESLGRKELVKELFENRN